ncbi:rhamnogalacturonan lyase [Halioxenophilus aromaticivorans]|uniref:Rhamnogalacturonan lyase n=1 Tax=Halioxenophilus aromaticivorans TaxID=1306992 RepID=A0AAV3U2C8_9ALTE
MLTAAYNQAGSNVAGATSDDTVISSRHLTAVAANNPAHTHISWVYRDDDGPNTRVEILKNGLVIHRQTGVQASSYLDTTTTNNGNYQLRINGHPAGEAQRLNNGYLEIPLNKPADRNAQNDEPYSYTINDASVGDLNGDGSYEIIIKWYPTIAKDNAFAGYTGNTLLDAYTLNGEQLWRIDLGPNIRSGAHYTQFMVYDLNSDGKDELVVKTADGTIDGAGKVIGNPNADWLTKGGELAQNDRTGSRILADGTRLAGLTGRVLSGPEYLTAFNGLTGEEISTVEYIPQRGKESHSPTKEAMKALWGDGYANRSDRFLAAVGHFDSQRTSVIFSRGYYAKSVIAAWDLIDNTLTPRWVFDTDAQPPGYAGQGNHQMSVADVDGDGLDEVVFGSMAIDHDGSPLWTAQLGHGDALHVADLDPAHPGIERFGVQEDMSASGHLGSTMLDAATGQILWSTPAEKDTGRGVCIDIDPNYPGSECWASNSNTLYSAQGKVIAQARPKSVNFAIYWDGDELREILDDTRITKWDWNAKTETSLLTAVGSLSNNGTKATPVLQADILGDWREELILRREDNQALRIYLTPFTTQIARPSLMTDRTYRLAIAWQNSAYNQPPHLLAGKP